MATPEVHAILSASSAHRWLNCPPSAVLAKQFPQTTSTYAEAGRLAHAICEEKVLAWLWHDPDSIKVGKLRKDPLYDTSMEYATDEYLEHIKSIYLAFEHTPFLALEERVDYSDIAPGGFGTADCIIIGGSELHIVDYKNGAGVPVEAEENPQLMLYAYGALRKFERIWAIDEVHIHIVQPHSGGRKSWSLPRNELDVWAHAYVAPIAKLAANGEGEHKAGEWCRFCPAKAQCRARAEALLSLEADKGKLPPLLSDSEVGGILTRALELEAWCKDLKDYAFQQALAGAEIPGFKVVEGRGSRDWADGCDAAFQTLQARGVPEAMLWERKPVSVAALEKAMGKKAFAEHVDLVEKKPGKPTLVPASDKRPTWNPAARAFEAVPDA